MPDLPELSQRELVTYVEALRSMPPPKPMKLLTLEDATRVKCMCGKSKDRRDMPQRHSGVVRFCDNVCRGCDKRYKGLVTVVCAKCGDVLGRTEPGKDPKDHFTMQPGRIYHVLHCDSCVQGLESSELIERILWRKQNNIPNPVKIS